jgi:hypothetical protein
MRPQNIYRSLLALALLQLGTAGAIPLSATQEPDRLSAPAAVTAISAEQLARSSASFEVAPERLAFGSASDLTSESALFGPRSSELRQTGHHIDLQDQLRSFVNVDRRAAGAARPGAGRARAQNGAPGFAGIDLGEATEEWIRDSVRSLLDSVLRLEVNERGRTSFSVLGMGDFSVTVAGGGSAFILSEGDDVLFVAQRAAGPQGGASYAGADMPIVHASAARYASPEQSSLRQALDLLLEMASHPVSLLVYCIVAAYMVLWTILSRQKHGFRQHATATVTPLVSPLTSRTRSSAAPSTHASRSHRSRSAPALAADRAGESHSAPGRRHRRRSRSRRLRQA